MIKRQLCPNSRSSILKYVTSNPSSTPSTVPVNITNAMSASTFQKDKHVVTQGSVQSNFVSHSASTVVPDPVAISSKAAFQSDTPSVDVSCLNTQCSTSIAPLKEETSCDVTSVKALFNLLDSGLIRASRQKCSQVLGKTESQASITDWLEKSCNNILTAAMQ